MFGDKETNNNYISLEDATKYCAYTQEYLSLRARQGKLKAAKFGRNWVTTKEWLDDYSAGVMEYSNNLKNNKKIPKEEIKKESLTPENLPVGEVKLVKVRPFYAQIIDGLKSPEFRFGVVFLITLTLIITGAFLEKDSFREVAAVISVPVKESFSEISDDIKYRISKIETKINEDEIYSATIYGTIETYQEYLEWLGKALGEQISKVENSTPVLVVGKTAKNVWNVAKTGYTVADNFIEENISVISDGLSGLYQFVTKPRPKEKPQEEIPGGLAKDIEFLRQEIEKLKEEGLSIKEITKEVQVSKVTKIEPIKEVTKEIIKISDAALANLQNQVVEFASWSTDIENLKAITQKLQAQPANTYAPTAPIYIGSSGLQVGGSGNFTSLGVSGPLGAKDLGVGGSTTLGSLSGDKLTVKSTSTFEAPVTAQNGLTLGTGATAYTLPTSTGTTGQAIKIDNSGNVSWGNVAGSPGGSTGQIQYNNAGAFGGASQFYYDATNDRVGIGTSGPDAGLDVLATSGAQLRLTHTDGSVYSGFTVDASGDLTITATGGDISFDNENITTTGIGRFSTLAVGTAYTFPNTDGSANQVLQTNGSGTVSWASISVSADVTGVGDCTGGDCFDGTIDGGNWLKFYDAQGIGQLITGDLSQARIWTLPDATGTVITTGNLGSITSTGTITSGTWRGTAVEPGYGGTGLSSYATGDMLYASAATTLSKLAIGSANYVLTSSGTAPQWSNSLTLAGLTMSGNITMANSNWLGLGSSAGRISWTDAATDYVVISDAYLGIGNANPSVALDVSGKAIITSTTTPQLKVGYSDSKYITLSHDGTNAEISTDTEGDIYFFDGNNFGENYAIRVYGYIGATSDFASLNLDDGNDEFLINVSEGSPSNTLDVAVKLDDAGGSSVFRIRDSEGSEVFSVDSDGTLAAGTTNISGLATFSYTPQGTGVSQGSLYINPATATADYTLLGLAVNNTEKFKIDEDGDVAVGTWKASTIDVSYGGTGLASYAAGDMLYASGATALSKLTIATAGYVLTSSGTLPQWSNNIAVGALPTGGNWNITSDLTIETPTLFIGHDGGSYPGLVGIGTTSPDRPFHAELSGTATSDVSYLSRLSRITSGTADAGFGTGLEFELENASGTNRIASAIQSVWEDATNATEDASLRFLTIQNGTLTEAMRIDDLGRVGIGTTGPSQKLEVSGNILASGNLALGGASLDANRGINYSSTNATNNTYGTYNSVSIGTAGKNFYGTYNVFTTTGGDLIGSYGSYNNFTLDRGSGYGVYNTFAHSRGWTSAGGVYNYITDSGDNPGSAESVFGSVGIQNILSTTNDSTTQALYGSHTELTTYSGASDVGYGHVVVDNSASTGGTQYGFYVDLDDANVTNYSIYVNEGSGISYFGSNVGIGATGPTAKLTIQIAATPDAHLDLNPIADTPTANVTEGDIYMDNDGVLYIRSNTAWAAANAAADFSELIVPLEFEKEISAGARRYVGEIEAGDVIVINQDGNYEISSKPYDLRVAGVESGDRGQYLLQEGTPERTEGQRQIGLIGHLLVKVNNENGPIEAGDFLATSSLPGYAMKATKAGAVVGKALEPFYGSQSQTGQIEVYVNAGWYGGELTEKGVLVDGEETTEEGGILENFAQRVKEALASLKEIIVEKLFAKTIRVQRMEMIDQRTGDIYCTWIEYGETKKVRGECDTIELTDIPPESDIPTISDTATPEANLEPTLPEIPANETTSPSIEGTE